MFQKILVAGYGKKSQAQNKNGGLGAAPAFAAALTSPFFQDI